MDIIKYINKELKSLENGFIATPSAEYLDQFTTANKGSNDLLLAQIAKQYGYKAALLNVLDEIKELKTK